MNPKLVTVAAILAAVALTATMSDFRLYELSVVVTTAVALLGLNLLTGYAGLISVGHGVPYAIGAYTAVILASRWNVPLLATIPIAGVLSTLLGLAASRPALRLRGFGLPLISIALAVALPQVLKRFDSLTGGSFGMSAPTIAVPEGIGLSYDQVRFVLCVVVALVLFWVAYNLTKGPIGLAMVALRDNGMAAASSGVVRERVHAFAFAIGCGYAGVAGSLLAIVTQYVSPDSFQMGLSISLLAGVVIGGLGRVSGALIGGAFLTYTSVYVGEISDAAPGLIYGAILIATMILLPTGVAGIPQMFRDRLQGRWPRRTERSTAPVGQGHLPSGTEASSS